MNTYDTTKLLNKGIILFGGKSKFYEWLNSDVSTLDNRKPIDLIEEGKGNQVYSILGEIEQDFFKK